MTEPEGPLEGIGGTDVVAAIFLSVGAKASGGLASHLISAFPRPPARVPTGDDDNGDTFCVREAFAVASDFDVIALVEARANRAPREIGRFVAKCLKSGFSYDTRVRGKQQPVIQRAHPYYLTSFSAGRLSTVIPSDRPSIDAYVVIETEPTAQRRLDTDGMVQRDSALQGLRRECGDFLVHSAAVQRRHRILARVRTPDRETFDALILSGIQHIEHVVSTNTLLILRDSAEEDGVSPRDYFGEVKKYAELRDRIIRAERGLAKLLDSQLSDGDPFWMKHRAPESIYKSATRRRRGDRPLHEFLTWGEIFEILRHTDNWERLRGSFGAEPTWTGVEDVVYAGRKVGDYRGEIAHRPASDADRWEYARRREDLAHHLRKFELLLLEKSQDQGVEQG